MKIATFVACCAAMLVAAPLHAQSRGGSADALKEDVAPKSGVRFVICSPSNAQLPSPLYYKAGKEFKTVNISSRIPSRRIRPEGGKVEFWDEDPGEAAAAEKGKEKGGKKKMPEPVLSVPVPSGSGKMLCIVVPGKEVSRTQTYFLKESDFPKKGMHIINFSSYPLKMITSDKGDFSDSVEKTIGVFRRDEGISANNTWSYVGEEVGKSVAFALMYKDKDAKEFKRLKASMFSISGRQAQINMVVKDASRNAPKLLSIQLMEDK
ncbi:MAG: hypothetical protein IJ498_02625 [Akkermansia sp.]|nr:hypothetical protein [Akkermansia sp.]